MKNLAGWNAAAPAEVEIPFKPARVVLQDFTGVPCVVDLAAMRSAMQRLGGDPKRINPLIPGRSGDRPLGAGRSLRHAATRWTINVDLEFSAIASATNSCAGDRRRSTISASCRRTSGIVHQVNLEYLAKGVFLRPDDGGQVAVPDTLVGTDSHTTMINGLGVVGWGVGGIEAEAVMLGQPLYMLMPEVVGFELTGQLPAGATATDLVLTVTQILRKEGVVGKFVEFFGAGVSSMKLADRATIGNMAPEYGATMGFFPVDDETLDYLRSTGRTEAEVRTGRALLQGAGTVPHRRRARRRSSRKTLSARSGHASSRAWPGRSGRRTACRWRTMKQSFRKALASAGRRARLRARRSGGRSHRPSGRQRPLARASATGRSSSPPSPVARTPATPR